MMKSMEPKIQFIKSENSYGKVGQNLVQSIVNIAVKSLMHKASSKDIETKRGIDVTLNFLLKIRMGYGVVWFAKMVNLSLENNN